MGRPTVVVRSTVIAIGVCYTGLLWLSDLQLDTVAKHVVALLPALGTGVLALWDLVLWRLPLLQRLHRRPRLDGLWQLTLRPSAESHIPPAGNRGPIDAYLEISQSFWAIHVRELTEESSSRSRALFWERPGGAAVEQLTFLYENDPKAAHQPRSMRHLGACTLEVAKRVPTSLEGSYFTDRYTKGDMSGVLVDRSRGYSSFLEAHTYARGQEGPSEDG